MGGRTLWTERVGYGLGSMGIALFVTLITAFLTIYLTNVAFLDVAAVSLIMAVSRVFDGISDIVIGNIIDNTNSKLGRARAWLLRMCLPFALSMFLLFRVPSQWPEMVKYIYVFLMYNLVNTVIRTFVQIAHYSLVPLITDDAMEQGLLGNIQSIAMNLGMMGGSVIFVKLLDAFTDIPGNQNTQRAYSGAVMVFGMMLIATTIIMVVSTKERVSGPAAEKKKQAGIKEKLAGLKLVLLNRDWLVMVICVLLCSLILQTRMTGATYYALYILGDMDKVAWLNAFNLGASMMSQFITPFLMKKYGMRKVYIAGIVIVAAGHLGFGLSTSSVPAMTAFLIMGGVGNGFYHAMIPGIFAVLITDIAERSGKMQAGIGHAGISAANKLGQGLGSVLFGFSLSAAGFNAMLDAQGMAQPQAVSTAISSMYVWMPLALYVIVFVLFTFFFDRDRRLGESGVSR